MKDELEELGVMFVGIVITVAVASACLHVLKEFVI